MALAKSDLVIRHDGGILTDKRFVVIRRLGAGSFGTVDLLWNRRSGMECVCKTVNIRGMKATTLALMKKEIMLLKELDHPRIVRLYEYSEDDLKQSLQLILEFVPGGDCDTLIKNGRRPSESLVARLMQQVLSATAYCHARGIVHCDLKPENVILTRSPLQAQSRCPALTSWCREPIDCKVIDFGLAAHFAPSAPEGITQFAGTPAFIAPEVVGVMSGGSFGPKADIWSIGVMTFNLLTGRLPFGHHSKDYGGDYWKVFNNIKMFNGIDFDVLEWDDRSEDACQFVEDLMCVDAECRLSAAEALQHAWFEVHTLLQQKRLKRSMLRNLRDFAQASDLVKICLLLIASRLDSAQLTKSRRAFMRLDVSGTGSISLQDLQEAIDNPGGCCPCCFYPRVDAEAIFKDVNLSQNDTVEFTEFAAATLYPRLRQKSGRKLAAAAFAAFDEDGDGLITAAAVLGFFACKHREDFPLLEELPQDRPFDENEFYEVLRRRAAPNALNCSSLFCNSVRRSDSYTDNISSDYDEA